MEKARDMAVATFAKYSRFIARDSTRTQTHHLIGYDIS